jgi:hypothetical protein
MIIAFDYHRSLLRDVDTFFALVGAFMRAGHT